ncbi:unnamed protein product [Boreogadus saida]
MEDIPRAGRFILADNKRGLEGRDRPPEAAAVSAAVPATAALLQPVWLADDESLANHSSDWSLDPGPPVEWSSAPTTEVKKQEGSRGQSAEEKPEPRVKNRGNKTGGVKTSGVRCIRGKENEVKGKDMNCPLPTPACHSNVTGWMELAGHLNNENTWKLY